MNSFIRIENLHFTYKTVNGKEINALKGIDLTIDEGEYIAIIGANGSGKSTLLRHLNALLIPTDGDVWVSDFNTRDSSSQQNIRKMIGMVFQVPDTQIVATMVEEDVAFGPENLGIPEKELRERVDWALEVVGLKDFRNRPSHLLSAGQKQLLVCAGALSMKPRCLVFDEPTSMLDPGSRCRFIETIKELHREGMTIVSATHSMEEATLAQRIIALSEGRIGLSGSPRFVFTQEKVLKNLKLDLPKPMKLAMGIRNYIDDFPGDVLTVSELLDALTIRLISMKRIYR